MSSPKRPRAWPTGDWSSVQETGRTSHLALQNLQKTGDRRMKFMITWKFHPGQLHDGLAQFSQMTAEHDAADMGSEIKLLGRWHDLARARGVAICESDSAAAVSNWALNWNSIMDVDVAVVLDDEETRALGKARSR